MTTMVKLVLLLLIVFKATALENPRLLSPYYSPSPLSDAPTSSDVEEEKLSKALCIAGCAFTCLGKFSVLKAICLGVCIGKCVTGPENSLNEITCTLDCAQSATNDLPRDAIVVEDLGLSCYNQCKKD